MSDSDDPFRIDPEKTVIRPMPGRPSVARPAPRPAAGAPPTANVSFADLVPASANPIVAAASPLIAIAIGIRGSANQPDIAALRNRIMEELKLFQERLRAAGIPAKSVQTAHRTVCALLDDVVLNTPWGAHSAWRSSTLFSVFHGQVTGGDWFFETLKQLLDERGNADLLEIMYLCLSLGFEGRVRMQANGPAELARVREIAYAAIRRERGEFERELSPHWQGVQAAHKSIPSQIPIWVYASAAACVLLAVFVGLSVLLSAASNPVFAELARLPPDREPSITGGTALPNYASHADRLRQFLAPEISAHLVSVGENDRTITISLAGNAMFAPGSTDVADRYVDVLLRIGGAVQQEPGQINVVGHTDNTPIHTIRFPSNYELSLARAEAARNLIRSRLSDPQRVSAQGMGDSTPLATNDTPEGREQNRRIEIVLMKPLAG
ncbi:MAG: type IVB secretion system protein IcmH/DotU [Alphaproteobacteria bacterium]|nr:type IVB secretion system protein IcmH/DotU [Alphaproteobacteria bacterium]